MKSIWQKFHPDLSGRVLDLAGQALEEVLTLFEAVEKNRSLWQYRVIQAFQKARISESAYLLGSGYGYSDRGRKQTEDLFAAVFCGEEALVRIQISSGTQMIAASLRGLLRPGDRLLIASGRPYDTLIPFLGIDGKTDGSLADFGIHTDIVELREGGFADLEAIFRAIRPETKVVYVQKSRGYDSRPALLNKTVREIADVVGSVRKGIPLVVDYCYSEFVEPESSLETGADLIIGSLIKNPGAGIAPGGAYVVGRKDLIRKIDAVITAPGLAGELGPSLGYARALQQGLYFAPRVVAEALKGAMFSAAFFRLAGFDVSPLPAETRADIVQSIVFRDRDLLIRFCEAIQHASPVDSFVTPVPSPMPGYACDIIMASGSFISGSSIELSADGPLREPFTAFLQGGLALENIMSGVMTALENILNDG
jgi:cystathionine beta-lyase family protein involved in aluminum resistance